MLKDLTIVIPTYCRHQYVIRSIEFWSKTEVTLLVFDGSDFPIDESIVRKFSANISYYHMPGSLHKRLETAGKLINTKYVVLLSDDEFFIPSGLNSCIAELEGDNDLVACAGRCLAFSSEKSKIIGFPIYPALANYSISDDRPGKRMLYHMSNYTPSTIYAVSRAEAWILAINVMSVKQFPVYSIDELQFELAICHEGKSKVLPELVWLRSFENIPVRVTSPDISHSNPSIKIFQWWSNTIRQKEKKEFLEVTAMALSRGDNEKHRVISDTVEKALDAYVTIVGAKARSNRNSLQAKLVSLLPKRAKKIIKSILKKYLNYPAIQGSLPFLDVAKQMIASGVYVNLEELGNIENILLKFHHDHR